MVDESHLPIVYGDKVRKLTGTRTYGRLLLRRAGSFTGRGSSVTGAGTGAGTGTGTETGAGVVRSSFVLGAGACTGGGAARGSSVLGTGTTTGVGVGGRGGAGS